MGAMAEVLRAAREAYARRDWPAALEGFRDARRLGDLAADDAYAAGDAAWWLGEVDEALAGYEEAYHRYLAEERPRRAAMAAIDVAVSHFLRGEAAIGSGWTSRAGRLLDGEPECAEHGYLRYMEVEAGLEAGTAEGLLDGARLVRDIGRRHGDPNLVAVGTLAEGRLLVRQGRVDDGMALLDEAMLAAVSDRLDPAFTGNVYCHLISACHELADLRRAGEWTGALERWCRTLPAAVVFTGICRVHRAQVLHLQGAWEEAEREAGRVCRELPGVHLGSAAEGHYALGDLRRVRGDLAGAEESYRQAHDLGRDPQPGLALLRLAQGRPDVAAAAIAAALAGRAGDPLARTRLLAAQVEISLTAGDLDTARAAGDELDRTAQAYGSSGLVAMARHARGAVLLGEGQVGASLPVLRAACQCWHDARAPYDAARVRVLLARAYRALGDGDAAGRELETAAATFERLGAGLDARAVAALRGAATLPGGLTEREAEVLRLVAAGHTNRDIAAALVISEKTVARHLSNIFTKLGVSSRTQAAAYAFRHQLATAAPEPS